MSPREQIRAVLDRQWERPVRAAARAAVRGLPIAILVLLEQFREGFFSSPEPGPIVAASVAVSLALWGADRLWYGLAGPLLARPFSIAGYLSRLPFWYLAGGMALEAALLAMRAAGLAGLYGVPARDLFDAGARVGLVGGVLWHAALYPSVQRLLAPGHDGTPRTRRTTP
jgi:hypothetical protein